MGTNSTKKERRLPMQPEGMPMGVHSNKVTPCRCGGCLTGVHVNTSAKIGNKAAAQAAQETKKKK